MLKMLALFSMLGLGVVLQPYRTEQSAATQTEASWLSARLPSAMAESFPGDPQIPWYAHDQQ